MEKDEYSCGAQNLTSQLALRDVVFFCPLYRFELLSIMSMSGRRYYNPLTPFLGEPLSYKLNLFYLYINYLIVETRISAFAIGALFSLCDLCSLRFQF